MENLMGKSCLKRYVLVFFGMKKKQPEWQTKAALENVRHFYQNDSVCMMFHANSINTMCGLHVTENVPKHLRVC